MSIFPPDPNRPDRLLSIILRLVFTPGWQPTLKVVLLTLVFMADYLAIHRPM